ncbi:MAG TPA: hypothetical protein VFR81_05190 [Longimicrobium sp.]|nr:hypothetical protein [Longimicrobium sp.]
MMRHPIRAAGVAAIALLGACENPGEPEPQVDPTACDRLNAAGAVYAGDVQLGVGEAMPLAAGSSLCLALPDAAGREYVLAYVDTRAIEASRTAREPALDSFTVTLRGGAGAAASRTPVAPGAARRAALQPHDDFRTADAPGQVNFHPAARQMPWTQGETFTLLDNIRGGNRPARVHRVYDGWLVVASFDDTPPPGMAQTVAVMDQAWPSIRQHGMPMLTAAFGRLPFSSLKAGQLLLVFRPDISAGGVAYGATNGVDVFSWLAVRPLDVNGGTMHGLASVVFHEITHAFQRQYLSDTRPAGTPAAVLPGGGRWGIEGGASLMQRELYRRQAGLGLTTNFDWRAATDDAQMGYANYAQPGDGSFHEAYGVSAGLLNDLVVRRTRAGEPLETAITEVLRGAVEGWYGWVGAEGPPRAGMTERTRAKLGGGWSPAEGMLTWALSHAMDDRTRSDVFQDRAFKDVGEVYEGEWGWAPHAEVGAGSGASSAKRLYGSAGFYTVVGGGAFHVSANREGVRWMIGRVK